MAEFRRGFPKTCKCEATVVMKTSKTAKNPKRLFHACPNGLEEDKWFHMFKLTDEYMVEKIEDLIDEVDNIEGASIKLHKALGACESRSKLLKRRQELARLLLERSFRLQNGAL